MSAGHIQRRGKSSWRLKFEGARDPKTGKRNIKYVTVHGTKREAKVKLAELIAAVGGGSYAEPTKLTVGDYVLARIDQWEAPEAISARTAQRYRQLANGQVIPQIGSRLVQKLTTLDVETWHAALRASGRSRGNGGVSPRTVVHAPRTLSHALDDAVRHGMVPRKVAQLQAPPKVQVGEMAILDPDGIDKLSAGLRGHPMYPTAIVALFTGMRLREILALRSLNVDLDAKLIRVREALEETKAHGLRFKSPKSTAGRRDIGLPEIVVEALREHRRQQLELRMAVGAGKPPADALVFSDPEGDPQAPSTVSLALGGWLPKILVCRRSPCMASATRMHHS